MQDFKSYTFQNKKRGRTLFKRILLALFLLGAIGLTLLYTMRPANQQTTQPAQPAVSPSAEESGRVTLPLTLPGQPQDESRALPEPAQESATTLEIAPQLGPEPELPAALAEKPAPEPQGPPTHRVSHQIVGGDTLSSIFSKFGLSASLLHRIVHSSKAAGAITDIRPGETLHIELDEANNFVGLTLEHSKINSLRIAATEDGFTTSNDTKAVERRTAHIQGSIDNSLYLSAKQAGLPEALIMELANIFGWDIDFALEIRTGDSFSVIYQEEYLEGEKLQNGPILAAEFINQGRSYRALRYEDASDNADYYTPEGKSMRKAFLRAPVDFRRISSRFARERWHPVLGKKRPHKGVDYAAKTGTPIKAAGDGKIIHRGTKGGYGRAVIIQHGQRYTTLYGHLSRYNKRAKQGAKVKQGQVIGYVGSSGLATGPHLHYEFRVNGVHRNPLTVKLPAAEPIAEKYRDDFLLKTQLLIAQLDTLNRVVVADAR